MKAPTTLPNKRIRVPERLLIVGASARAAAESAVRGGFLPLAVDQFGDEDLRRIADLRTCDHFPEQIPARAAELPPAGVVLTGAMENHPTILKRLTNVRRLYGCPLEALAAVRNPLVVQSALDRADLPTVATSRRMPTITPGVRWLKKPLRGSSGAGICLQTDSSSASGEDSFYYQKLLHGPSQSGFFLASRRTTTLVGVTEQWIGTPWLHARPFGYAGSLGPLRLDAEARNLWERIGTALSQSCGLIGFFGVDAVIQNGVICVVEVNPRFTASAEILDIAGDGQIMRHHVEACQGENVEILAYPPSGALHAKAIYFASQDIRIPLDLEILSWSTSGDNVTIRLADIPAPGKRIRKGQPVATLLATGMNADRIREGLQRAVDRLQSHLTCGTRQEVDSQAASASSRSVIGDQRRPANCG